MRQFLLLVLFLTSISARAEVISPTSMEVQFNYSSELKTSKQDAATALALEQAKHLFGYMQNPEIVKAFGLNSRIMGIGAPRWMPEIRILSEEKSSEARIIRYEAKGRFILNKEVAQALLARGEWAIEMVYDLDNVFEKKCTDLGHPAEEEFWYFNDPFRAGCEYLREEPFARSVKVQIQPAPPVDESKNAGLAKLRGDNGNGELFEIAAINGFDESSKSPKDEGRINFKAMNQWLRDQGFEETILSRFKNRPVHQFDKILSRKDGSVIRARVTRILVETDLDQSRNVTFAKFLKHALETSDVVIYEGHSGLGANLDLEQIESRLLMSKDKNIGERIVFNRTKQQLFLFDSCSSYSYYLGMFQGRKNPGTLAVMTNGIESLFGYEIAMTKHLYRQLLQTGNDDLTWMELLEDYEIPLRGNTFMLNVDLN